jgi:serine/threonine protein kinase
MLAGKVPFQGKSEYETLSLITKRDLNMPQDLIPEAQTIIDKLLSLDPADRLKA